MQEHERKIRPALAAIIVVCFFLPFVQLTCGGQQIASLTGLNLALGTTVKPPDMSNMFEAFPGAEQYKAKSTPMAQPDQSNIDQPTDPQNPSTTMDPTGQMSMGDGKIKPEPAAAAALALAAIAFLTSLSAQRRSMIISAVAAGIGAVLLFILKSNGTGDMPPEAMGIIVVKWTMAFWVALIGSAALAVFTFRTLSQRETPVAEKPRLVIQSYQDKQPTPQP